MEGRCGKEHVSPQKFQFKSEAIHQGEKKRMLREYILKAQKIRNSIIELNIKLYGLPIPLIMTRYSLDEYINNGGMEYVNQEYNQSIYYRYYSNPEMTIHYDTNKSYIYIVVASKKDLSKYFKNHLYSLREWKKKFDKMRVFL